MSSSTIDPHEIEGFEKVAEQWWDLRGPFRPLHALVPPRISFIRDQAEISFPDIKDGMRPFVGKSILDVGCGGGLLAEPLCRMGADVTGIDGGGETLEIARRHGLEAGLDISYRLVAAEDLAAEGKRFDIVVASEVVEHVADVQAFLDALSACTKPGGLVVLTTLNRTGRSYAIAILGAEMITRMIPRGTHQWNKFLKPSELAAGLRAAGLMPGTVSGMVPDPTRGGFRIAPGKLAVNYAIAARKP